MEKRRNTLYQSAAILICCISLLHLSAHATETNADASPPSSVGNDLRVVITEIAKSMIPMVVHIEVTQQQLVQFSPYIETPQSPFFDQPQVQKKFKKELKGLGTGILIDETGHILTNHHVVDEATDIKVILSNGKHYTARMIGKDQKTDIAIIKIKPDENLPFVHFGDSDKVEVGEWVVAIGHPRGLDQTVTQGIISAKHRRGITDPSSYQDFLQTDAAINPGNSGGPLINLKGEVIGINSIIASESGGYEGIGFAIPSNLAVSISKALIAFGKVKRGWIGITIQDLDPEKVKPLKIERLKGAGVVDVIKGGPADKGGMKKGDIIIRMGGKEVVDSGSLRNQIANTPIGTTIRADVLREDEETEVHIIVGDLDDSLKFLSGIVKDRLGIEVRPLRAQEADSYGVDAGVAIKWLDPKGPMAEAGFEAGDIILEIDGQSVQGVDDFTGMVSVLQPMQESVFLALDHRSGQSTYVQVRIR